MTYLARKVFIVVSVVGFLVMLAGPAAAHPLGNFTTNSFSRIEISTDDVTVNYVVDMAEIPTFQLQERIQIDSDEELKAYAPTYASELLPGLALSVNGEPVELSYVTADAMYRAGQGGLKITRFEFVFRAPLPEDEASLSFVDNNFENKIGWREIVVRPTGEQGLVASSAPSETISDELRVYPKDLLSNPLEVRTAEFEVRPGAGIPGTSADGEGSVPSGTREFGGGFAELIEGQLSPLVILGAVLLAVGFGALHAIGPGHGKTIMAAYLVGAGGKTRQALIVGIAVSLMHTTSVVVLGLITLGASNLFAPEDVFPWLSFASGLIVLGLGAWLLQTRMRARRATRRTSEAQRAEHFHGDHAHDHHDHGDHAHEHAAAGEVAHSHGGSAHSHAPPAGVNALSWKGLGAIAVSGGLLPSPTALVVLLGAVALDRVAFGVALVAAFSVGLAAALTIVGVFVLRARDFAFRRLGSRVGTTLPLFSAAAILSVGLFLTTQAALNLPF